MKRVIFFYELVNREYESIRFLAKELEENGQCEVASFSITFEWRDAVRYAKIQGVDAVVFPWIYNDYDFSLTKPFFDVNPKVSIINLHQEQISSSFSDLLLLPRSENSKNACFHLAWGDYFADMLGIVGVRTSLISVTGSTRMDIGQKAPETKEYLSKLFSLNQDKQWILFAEDRGWLYGFSERQFNSLVKRGLSKDVLKERNALYLEALGETVRQINELPRTFFDSFELIYRPHPGTHDEGITNPFVRVISELPISAWLQNIDLLLVWGSTSAFEGERIGVPVLRHEPIEHPSSFLVHGLENFGVIHELTDITDDLIERATAQQMGQDVYKHFYGSCDGSSVRKTKEAILNALNEAGHLDKPVFKVRYIYRLMRKTIFEIVSRFAVRLNLVQRLKWPRIAYNLYGDIPYVDSKKTR